MQDVLLKATTALPNGNATTTSTALDLQAQGGAYIAGKASLWIRVPATPTLANTKTLTVAITDCATSGGSYTAVTGYGRMVITGPASGGGPATNFELALHPGLKQFVKVTYTGESSGGDLSAVSAVAAIEIP
jgi:hypothetical protein